MYILESHFPALPFQVTSQQQELAVLDTQLGHRREELLLLQDSLVQAKADLQEALTLGETEVAEKCSHIRVCWAVGFLRSPRQCCKFILKFFPGSSQMDIEMPPL